MSNQSKTIDQLLSEFETKKVSGDSPSISIITNEVQRSIELNHPIINDLCESFLIDVQENPNLAENLSLKICLYGLGVSLFELSILKKIKESINPAMRLFEQTILIDNKYFQAFNRWGDCLLYCLNEEDEAISCYKASIEHEGSSIMSIFKSPNPNQWQGNNYLGIGIALIRKNRKEDAKVFLSESQNILGEVENVNGFGGYHTFNFNNWEEVFKFLEDY